MTRMIVDCDPGHDDAIALILAHRCAEVLAVTTVSGNAPLAATTENALMVLALLEADTPVHAGAARPLVGAPKHAFAVHGESGLDGVPRIDHGRVPASEGAVAALLEGVAPDVWIVALGPLTNLALALQRDPSWPQRIAGISIMGGSATVGNATPAAEFNIWADPEAAAQVFASGANLIQCGLNLTHQLRTDDAVVKGLRNAGNPLARFAAHACHSLHTRMFELIGERSAALHDPCAVLAVTHPHLIEAKPRSVGVELNGMLTRGMTVVDERVTRRREAPNINVGYRIDAEAAMRVILMALGA